MDIYHQAQRRIIEQSYGIPIYVLVYNLAVSSGVDGITIDAHGFPEFHGSWLNAGEPVMLAPPLPPTDWASTPSEFTSQVMICALASTWTLPPKPPAPPVSPNDAANPPVAPPTARMLAPPAATAADRLDQHAVAVVAAGHLAAGQPGERRAAAAARSARPAEGEADTCTTGDRTGYCDAAIAAAVGDRQPLDIAQMRSGQAVPNMVFYCNSSQRKIGRGLTRRRSCLRD